MKERIQVARASTGKVRAAVEINPSLRVFSAQQDVQPMKAISIPRVFRSMAVTALACLTLRGAELPIEFTGVMKQGQTLKVALRSTTTGYSSWLTIGQTFEGYAIRRFEEPAETLVLAKEGTELRLRLATSQVKPGGSEPPPELKQHVLRNLRMLAAAADQFYLEHGVIRTSYDDLVGPTKYVKEIIPADGENYRSLQFVQGQPMEVRTNRGYVVSYRP